MNLSGGMAHDAWLVTTAFLITAISYLGVALIRFYAPRMGVLDVPNERSSHLRPVPSGGGLALIALNILAWIWLVRSRSIAPGMPIMSTKHVLAFIIGGLLIAGVSFIDDLGHVPYPIRLAVQAVAAGVFVGFYAFWQALSLPLVGMIVLGGLGVPVTILWIVGLVNAYNFIDGLDGLAAGQAVVAGIGWVALGEATGHPLITALGGLLAASSLGFLAHNWQPARIFMGDVGSTFLGYSFAVLPVIAARYDMRLALAGVLLVWPAIFDSSFTVLSRLRRRQNIFEGHREFLFHRLVAAGWSHSAAASLYVPLPLLGAGLAFTWQYGNPMLHGLVVCTLAALCLGLWGFVRREEDKHRAHQLARAMALVEIEERAEREQAVNILS